VLARDGNNVMPLSLALRNKHALCASFLLTKQWSKVCQLQLLYYTASDLLLQRCYFCSGVTISFGTPANIRHGP